MSLLRFFRSLPRRLRSHFSKQFILKSPPPAEEDLASGKWVESLTDPADFYKACTVYFHRLLSEDLRLHRQYFSREQRGFGEDAFHVMWWLLFNKFRPASFLEIGVYRGQTLSLASLLQRKLGIVGSVTGISPFASAGDRVTKYREDVNYYEDTLKNFAFFKLPLPNLCRAFSTDPAAVGLIQKSTWDCIYIDGNHDYEVALADWNNSSQALAPGGLIVLDDSGLTTTYRAPAFATAGHPGPSRLAAEIDRSLFAEILQVGHNRIFQKR